MLYILFSEFVWGICVSLRDEKQARLRGLILDTAVTLFRARGFEAVPVREIARECAISEATFFNYFTNKEALLREWAWLGFEAAGQHPEAAPLRHTVRRWTIELAHQAESDRAMMTKAWGRVRSQEAGGELAPARGRRVGAPAGAALIKDAQDRGEVRTDVSAEQLAQVLRSALAGALADGLMRGDAGGPGPLGKRLAGTANLVLDGFRKRNERVSAPAARGASS